MPILFCVTYAKNKISKTGSTILLIELSLFSTVCLHLELRTLQFFSRHVCACIKDPYDKYLLLKVNNQIAFCTIQHKLFKHIKKIFVY